MVKIVLGIVLVAHGIGHALGLLPLTGFAPTATLPGWTGHSWIVPTSPPALGQVLGGALWAAALVGFIALGIVVLGWLPASWWEPLAVGAAIASLAAIALFPAGFPTVVNIVGAAVVDIVLLAAVVINHWTPASLDA